MNLIYTKIKPYSLANIMCVLFKRFRFKYIIYTIKINTNFIFKQKLLKSLKCN